MKKLLFFTLLAYTVAGNAQDWLSLGRVGASLNFDYPDEYQFVKIDTNNLWFIAEPKKEILFLPPNAGFGTHALISDTAQYYKRNIKASFQFKLLMGEEGYTYLVDFNHIYDFEKNKDGGIIETSYDNGLTWQNIIFDTIIMNHIYELSNLYTLSDTISSLGNQPGFTGTQPGMTFVIIEFYPNEDLRGDTLTLRFTFSSDSVDINNEGWMLDYFNFGGKYEDGIINNKSNVSIKIHPVPVKDKLIVETEFKNIETAEIYSLAGQLIFSASSNHITSIDVSDLEKGFYLIQLKYGNRERWISKFCKI
ncbi:MAG: T9SS type A sorting domain-containing protein [Bacteroidales bacterium]|nr:T9SS type A sorting domain-containing protein [Bacteroidales bacterium]